MRPWPQLLLSIALVGALAAPADAHIVYFKDGTVVRGTVSIKENAVTIAGGGAEISFPLASVRAISFSDEPIAYEQRRSEDSKLLNNEALMWSAIAANVAAVVVALVGIVR